MTSPFPSTVATYPTWKESNAGTNITDEVVRVPAGSPYRAWLVQKPRHGATVAARVQTSGALRTRIEWGAPIIPGTYALRERDGALDFHPNDANTNLLFTYVGVGSVVRADIIKALQDDIKAVMNYVKSDGKFIAFDDEDISPNTVLMMADNPTPMARLAPMYMQNDGSMRTNSLQTDGGTFLRKQIYGSGGSVSLANGWNRIMLGNNSPSPVQGIFELSYTLPSSVRGKIIFMAACGETVGAQLTVLSNTCNGTNSVFTAMRIVRPNSSGTAAALEVYLTTATVVILEVRLVSGSLFGSASQNGAWTFQTPAVAGSTTGGTAYELTIAGLAFGTNSNGTFLTLMNQGSGVGFLASGSNGIILTGAHFCPNAVGGMVLGDPSLPWGEMYATFGGATSYGSNVTPLKFNADTNQVERDAWGGVAVPGSESLSVTFYDTNGTPITMEVQGGIIRSLTDPEGV